MEKRRQRKGDERMNTKEFIETVLAKLDSIEQKLTRIEKIKTAQDEPCPKGQHRDPETQQCVDDVPPSTELTKEECEAKGGIWNEESKTCTLPKTESVGEGLTSTPHHSATEELEETWRKEDAEMSTVT